MLDQGYKGAAIWANEQHDMPVLVTAYAGEHDGQKFFYTDQGKGALPADQLRPAPILNAALAYARAGLSVIPVDRLSKKPLVSWTKYQREKADEQTIIRWFADGSANIGIVCGQASGNLRVMDFDQAELYHEWRAALVSVVEAATATVIKTGKGFHVYLLCEAPGRNDKLAWIPDEGEESGRRVGIETRAEGGYVVAPPSVHQNGTTYQVIQGDLTALTPVTQDVVDLFTAAAQALDRAPWTRQEIQAAAWSAPAQQPDTDQSVIDAYNRANRIEDLLSKNGYTQVGKAWARPGGDHTSVYIRAGKSFHHNSNDPLSNGHWRSPFDLYVFFEHGGDVQAAVKQAAADLGIQRKKKRKDKDRDTGPMHNELRDRWLVGRAETASFGKSGWRRYTHGIWPELEEQVIRGEIMHVIEAATPEGIRPTSALLHSVTELARTKCHISLSRFDADPDTLVCQNGTLNIPTLTLREHSPEDYATFAVPYDYDPGATAPTWEYFLESTLQPDVVNFLQEFAGYSLTTDCSLETAVWLFGPGGSGKSTFITGLLTMLGERAGNLGLAEIERNRFALGKVPGKTLLFSMEQPASFVSTVNLLNALISGEQITVERKYQDPVDIVPHAKLAWAMNELPRIPEAGSGIFRRVKIIQFAERAEQERIPDVKIKIGMEGAGILNWALTGLARLRQLGNFDVPAAVRAATDDFKQANDIPAAFLADCCERRPKGGDDLLYRVPGRTLYQAYRAWCEDTGHKPQSETTLAADWARLGLEKHVIVGIKYWFGARILPANIP